MIPTRVMRHLFYTGEEQSLCGLFKKHFPGSVHVSRARKTDCFTCRAGFRKGIRDRSGKRYMTKAERQAQFR